MRSSLLVRGARLFHRTGVMGSSMLLRRSLVRRGRSLRLRRIRLGLCLSWVRFFRGVLAL